MTKGGRLGPGKKTITSGQIAKLTIKPTSHEVSEELQENYRSFIFLYSYKRPLGEREFNLKQFFVVFAKNFFTKNKYNMFYFDLIPRGYKLNN